MVVPMHGLIEHIFETPTDLKTLMGSPYKVLGLIKCIYQKLFSKC